MNGKNLLVVALVGLLAIVVKGGWGAATGADASAGATSESETRSVATPKRAPATGASKNRPGAPCAAADPICQVRADFPGAFGPLVSDQATQSSAAPTTVILATVPDPNATAFAADFDRAIEAIGRGSEGVGYVAQRHWFPWDPGVAESDAGKPGWLLFRRRAKGVHDLLLVLLAREHPASGIDRAEFTSALAKLKEASDTGALGNGHNKVLLLGPYFSGTAASLDQQLRAWCATSSFCRTRQLVAVSGSATVRRTQDTLQGLSGVFATSAFHATVLPDDLLQAGMRRFLRERLEVSVEEVADLTESSTVYGTASLSGLKIPFPMHVGLLADKNRSGKQEGIDEGSELPRTFDTDSDKIGLQLDNTFAALSRFGIKHVGILATSTRDKIFLAQQLRQWAPDLRVHMYEGTIDLADRAQRRALEGVMVASSYPLFPTTQLWSGPSRGALQQFPSMAAEGVYNAVLALLAETNDRLAPRLGAKLLDYQAPFCDTTVVGPSTWVSVSIENRLWPLAAYPISLATHEDEAGCAPGADPFVYLPVAKATQDASVRPPPRSDVSFLSLLGALVILALMIGNGVTLFIPGQADARWRLPLVTYRFVPTRKKDQRPKPDEAADERDETLFRRVVWGVWALAIIGAVMGKLLYLPQLLFGSAGSPLWQRALALSLCWGALAQTVAAAIATCRRRDGQIRRWALCVQAALCAALAVGILVVPLPGSLQQPDGHAFFLYLRAMDPGVGLTPTIPLFIAGMTIYLACLMQLAVLRRAETLTASAEEWEPTTVQSFTTSAKAMRRFAHRASRSLGWICAGGAAVGFVILFWSRLRLGSFEGRLFDGGCSFCFALVFTTTLASAWRAQSLWIELQDFTRALAIHPAVTALQRLPDSVARRFASPAPGQVGNRHIQTALDMIQHALGLAAAPTISELRTKLEPRWFPLASNAKPPAETETKTASDATPEQTLAAATEPLTIQEKLEEDFLALKMADALGLMCDATRTMLFVATGTGMAALFGYALYPFQPGAALTAAGLLSVGLVALVALRVLLGIERDHVLSMLAKTKSGEITPSLGLVARLVGYVIVPIGGLIGSRLQDQGKIIQLFQDLAKALSR